MCFMRFCMPLGARMCSGALRRYLERCATDPASPSGWRFRGSSHRAVEAYSRALRTVPSAQPGSTAAPTATAITASDRF